MFGMSLGYIQDITLVNSENIERVTVYEDLLIQIISCFTVMENEWVLTFELSFVALGTTLLKSHGHKKILMLRPIQQLWIGIDKKVLSFI